jgi:hypothetical protein
MCVNHSFGLVQKAMAGTRFCKPVAGCVQRGFPHRGRDQILASESGALACLAQVAIAVLMVANIISTNRKLFLARLKIFKATIKTLRVRGPRWWY